MKQMVATLMLTMAAMCVTADPTVTDVVAKQRYPWNGLVDITCKVTGINGTTNLLDFAVSAVMPDTGEARGVSRFWIVQNGVKLADCEVHTNGTYRLLWDAQADLGQVTYDNMVVRVTTVKGHEVQLWEGGPYWATTNIGAENPEDYGYYFWWGDTVGYTRSGGTWSVDYPGYSGVTWVSSAGQQKSSSPFLSSCPTHNKSNSALQSEGWIDSTGNLVPALDAAHVHWGGDWRMPTDAEISALIKNCTTTWTTRNGVYGRLVTGKGAYADRSIFLPAAGIGGYSTLYTPGSNGFYWSSTPDSFHSENAWSLSFWDSSDFRRNSYSFRDQGQSVRPVRDAGGPTDTYTVMYKPGVSGSGSQQTATKTHGVAMVLKGAIFTRRGYVQTGWATSDGGAKAYDLCASYTANAAVTLTLYPFWMKDSSTDTHDMVLLWEGGPYWATTNISAENPEDYGYYFWWGDTVGYTRSGGTWSVDYPGYSDVKWVSSAGQSSRPFSYSSCPTYDKDNSALKSAGYIDSTGNLVPAHDAAHVHWGGAWRMPTDAEISALIKNCTTTWTTRNGVYGRLVTGKGTYADRSIFLPAAGYGYDSDLVDPGSDGYYLSSTPDSDFFNDARGLFFDSSRFYRGFNSRSGGRSVRPVRGLAE